MPEEIEEIMEPEDLIRNHREREIPEYTTTDYFFCYLCMILALWKMIEIVIFILKL